MLLGTPLGRQVPEAENAHFVVSPALDSTDILLEEGNVFGARPERWLTREQRSPADQNRNNNLREGVERSDHPEQGLHVALSEQLDASSIPLDPVGHDTHKASLVSPGTAAPLPLRWDSRSRRNFYDLMQELAEAHEQDLAHAAAAGRGARSSAVGRINEVGSGLAPCGMPKHNTEAKAPGLHARCTAGNDAAPAPVTQSCTQDASKLSSAGQLSCSAAAVSAQDGVPPGQSYSLLAREPAEAPADASLAQLQSMLASLLALDLARALDGPAASWPSPGQGQAMRPGNFPVPTATAGPPPLLLPAHAQALPSVDAASSTGASDGSEGSEEGRPCTSRMALALFARTAAALGKWTGPPTAAAPGEPCLDEQGAAGQESGSLPQAPSSAWREEACGQRARVAGSVPARPASRLYEAPADHEPACTLKDHVPEPLSEPSYAGQVLTSPSRAAAMSVNDLLSLRPDLVKAVTERTLAAQVSCLTSQPKEGAAAVVLAKDSPRPMQDSGSRGRFKLVGAWQSDPTVVRPFHSVRSTAGTVSLDGHYHTYVLSGDSCLQPLFLHPSSQKRFLWDLISMALVTNDILVIPFVAAFELSRGGSLQVMNAIEAIFWTLDVLMSFLTGYREKQYTVMLQSRIARRYMRSWFLLDLLIVMVDWTLLLWGDTLASLKTFSFIRVLRVVRLLNVVKFMHIVRDKIRREVTFICFDMAIITALLLVANHAIACAWYAVGALADSHGYSSWVAQHKMLSRSVFYRYSTALHWSLTQFAGGSMEIVPYNASERIFAVFVSIFSMIASSWFVSILTAYLADLQRISTDEIRQFWLLRRYLHDWHVSLDVGTRVQRYADYMYKRQKQRVQTKDVCLLALLSEPLRDELRSETVRRHLRPHPLFGDRGVQTRAFTRAIFEVSLVRGDAIFLCGERARAMHFVTCAGAMIYQLARPSGRLHTSDFMDDEEWLCEAPLWTVWAHVGDAHAVKECQMVCVRAEEFGAALQMERTLWTLAQKYASLFVAELNDVDDDKLTDLLHKVISPNSIMERSGFGELGEQLDEPDVGQGLSRRLSCSWLGSWLTSRGWTSIRRMGA